MKKYSFTKFKLLMLATFLYHNFLYGQRIGFELIDGSNVKPWVPKAKTEYQAVYHFGDSEMESDLVLLHVGDKFYAQIKSGTWSQDGKNWIWNFENLLNVKVDSNKFFSNKTNGEFIIYENGQDRIKGLKVFDSWSGITEENEYEIGTKKSTISGYYSGKYPFVSFRQLNKNELLKISSQELKIMRNEVFARYGYIFQTGGEMDKYFTKQDWYLKQHKDVNEFLTDLEKENLKLIIVVEKLSK